MTVFITKVNNIMLRIRLRNYILLYSKYGGENTRVYSTIQNTGLPMFSELQLRLRKYAVIHCEYDAENIMKSFITCTILQA
jgi:hypothetical protein